MTEKNKIRLPALAKKNFHVSVEVMDMQTWRELTERDPTIPRSFVAMKRLGARLFSKRSRRAEHERRYTMPSSQLKPLRANRKLAPMRVKRRGILLPFFEECGESAYAQFWTGLRNPFLTKGQRASLEADIDADTPAFEKSHETGHFILRWTNESDHAGDNIADDAMITETGNHLEAAWDRYFESFGRAPYVPTGETKIEVLFHDIAGYGVASPPDGPIQFDSFHWVDKPGIRQPTSAHELFHKLQYAYGYRTTHAPTGDYKWFSEGSASWAEVFCWNRVSGSYKIEDLFAEPDVALYTASYRALPLWLFFEQRHITADDNPIRTFFELYELGGDERAAFSNAVASLWPTNNVHGDFANFFALFSRERLIGAWLRAPYTNLLGPDDQNIADQDVAITETGLASGDVYNTAGAVSAFGADYFRFVFEDGTNGQELAVSVDGQEAGDFFYYIIYEKDGHFTLAQFPFFVEGDYGFSRTINLNEADSAVIIIGGRDTGGSYELTAAIS